MGQEQNDPRTQVFGEHTDRAAMWVTDRGFRPARWRNRPALVSRDGTVQRPFSEGVAFDPEAWHVVPDAWDHEHCAVCWSHICECEDHGFPEAWINDSGEWICPPCFERYFAG